MTFAQQGSVALGVGSNLADVSWQNYSLTPTVGYFIADNMMVGTGFVMASETAEIGGVEEKNSGMNISPFFRYYMNDAFFGQAGILMTSSTYTVGDDYEYKESGFGLGAGVGYSLMWNEKVCIEPYFGFASTSGSSEEIIGSVTTSTDDPSMFAMAITLSIHIRLGGK